MVNDSWAYIDRIKRNGDEQKQKRLEKILLEEMNEGIMSRTSMYAAYAGEDES